jgi:outer membrane immunogenic protein
MNAPVPLPAFSWTGCYVGGQAGWGWARDKITNTIVTGAVTSTGTATLNASGPVYGAQVGCDVQFSGAWVAGIQGMGAGTDLHGLLNDPGEIHTANVDDAIGVKTKWISSVTGRFGYVGWAPQSLIYVRGGWAWAGYEIDVRNAERPIDAHAGIIHKNYNGWTLGAGSEWAFATNWSAFVEYNHYHFGSRTYITDVVGGSSALGVMRPRIDTVTFGVNYRFGDFGKRPVVTRY